MWFNFFTTPNHPTLLQCDLIIQHVKTRNHPTLLVWNLLKSFNLATVWNDNSRECRWVRPAQSGWFASSQGWGSRRRSCRRWPCPCWGSPLAAPGDPGSCAPGVAISAWWSRAALCPPDSSRQLRKQNILNFLFHINSQDTSKKIKFLRV